LTARRENHSTSRASRESILAENRHRGNAGRRLVMGRLEHFHKFGSEAESDWSKAVFLAVGFVSA